MNIKEFLDEASKLRICVIGDYIIDKYIEGDVTRISPEAPVPILRVKKISENPGGAGNVVANLQGLGCRVEFIYNKGHIPTKTRIMSNNHHLMRIDNEKDIADVKWLTPSDLTSSYYAGLIVNKFDAIILSDYGKGTISKEVAKEVIEGANYNCIPVIVDAKKDFEKFRGATVIKCNEEEYKNFPPNTHSHIHHISQYQVTTCGAKGMVLRDHMPIDGINIQLTDACGAGDTVTAVLAVAIAIEGDVTNAAKLANIAAASVCRFSGVHPINKDELIAFYNEIYGHPSTPSIQPFRVQPDEAKDQNSYPENIKAANGRGDERDGERQSH